MRRRAAAKEAVTDSAKEEPRIPSAAAMQVQASFRRAAR